MSGLVTNRSDPKREMRSHGFVLGFSTAGPLIYLLCQQNNWPLFTYHPGAMRFDWFYVRAMRDLGPAMYWYGWTAYALLGGTAVGLCAAVLPDGWTSRYPSAPVWVIPTLAIPWLLFALRFYWTK